MVLDNLRCPSNMGCQCTKHIVYVYDSSWGTVTNEMFSSLVWSHSTKTIQFICTYHRRTHTHILHPDTFFDKSVFHWYVAKTYVVRTRHRAVGLCAAVLWSCKLKRWFMADITTTILAFYSTTASGKLRQQHPTERVCSEAGLKTDCAMNILCREKTERGFGAVNRLQTVIRARSYCSQCGRPCCRRAAAPPSCTLMLY